MYKRQVSEGRFELGLGAGWNEEESGAYGIPLGTLTERFNRFDEALEVIISLLHEERTSFHGNFYQLNEALNNPKGPQNILPICIGGTGERRTLRSVAKFASHWNLPMFDIEVLNHKLGVLRRHCEVENTDINDIKVSTHVFVEKGASIKAVSEQIEVQREAGIDQSIIYFQPPVLPHNIEAVTDSISEVL